jgi:ornithine cyclodeaminase/alanine dehydrogenase-like protein (mu-crystallin family)
MLFLREDDVRRLLPMKEAVAVMRQMFESLAAGEAANQPRRRLVTPTGVVLHSLAGWWKGYVGTKVYVTHVQHGAHFLVWLCDATMARPLALLEANALGQIRTGAASGYATDLMAPQDVRTLGVIGAGFQAWTQVEAVLAVRAIEEVRVYSRSGEKRTRFAGQVTEVLKVTAKAVDSAEAAVRGADVVATATWAKDPVLEAGWVKPGAHINAVGSNQANRRELPGDLVARARWIAVDNLEQARLEAGDLLLAGNLDHMPVVELAAWGTRRREAHDLTIFKSIGLGVEDVAVAAHVYEKARV